MTAYGTIRDAVEAMKLGAFDYITKPFALDEFLLLIERALEMKRLKEENIRLRKDLNTCYRAPNIIGESVVMQRVFSLIEKVSASEATVLILGESGTGKELVATTIHYQSSRKNKPMAAPFFSTRSGTCLLRRKPRSSGSFRRDNSKGSAEPRHCPSTFALLPPRTRTWKRKSAPVASGKTCITGSMSFRSERRISRASSNS
jgi:hypothetical protein